MNGSGAAPRLAIDRAVSRHAVQFSNDDETLTVSAASFLAEGIAAGEPVVAFATPARRDGMRELLRQRGLDVDYLERESRLSILDARATLATFMSGDMPDVHKFNHSVRTAVERMCVANPGSDIRAFGEMVDLLWQDGKTRAAVRLEELWNDLATAFPISLLCSRAMHRSPAVRPVSLERQTADHGDLEARLREALVARRVAEEELERANMERERLLQREREARAEAEAANRAKAEFLSVMSHELRTPLNAIGGHVQLIDLELHGPVTPAQHEALARIARSQRHLLMLVNDVLNLARLETGQVEYALEEVDLNSIVRHVVDALQPLFEQSGLSSEAHFDTEDSAPLLVTADGEKIRQIMLNLLTNAVKFTKSGGHVSVSVGPSTTRAGHVAITVRDSGLGIAAVRLRQVFEPFGLEPRSTMHHLDGTGLSLAISRDLARGMGGELSASSVPGEGSTFTLELSR